MPKISLVCANSGYANTNGQSNGALVQRVFLANGSYKTSNNMYIQPVVVVSANQANLNYDANTEAIPITWVAWSNTQFRPNPGADVLYVTVVANEGIGHQDLFAADWTPAKLSLGAGSVWFDTTDIQTMDQALLGGTPAQIGAPVGIFRDKSGNGNHLVAPSVSARPILRSGEIEYDGVDDYFGLTTPISITTNMTIIRTFRRLTAGIYSIGFANSGTTPYDVLWNGGDNKIYSALGGTAAAQPDVANTSTGAFVVTVTRDGSNEVVRLNGTQIGTRAAPAVSGSLAYLGRRNANYNSGYMGSTLIIPRVLTAPEIASAERYFGAQVGLGL